jgi:uncharacterized protein YhfF
VDISDISEDVVQLGFAGDDGLGDLLVQRLRAGSLTVLWEPVDLLDDDEVAVMRSSVDAVLTVVDGDGEPAANVRVLDVFTTTWGDPDPRLVRGEGYGVDVDAWQRFAGPTLAAGLAEDGLALDDHTELLVQTVEVTEVAPEGDD